MRKLLAVASAALGLLGMTAGQVQAAPHGGSSHGGSFHGGSFHGGSFHGGYRGGGFRGGGYRGGGYRGGGYGYRGGYRGYGYGGAFAAGALGFGLGAALASPYYYGSEYDYYGGPDGYYDDYGYDSPAYACGAWQWDSYRHRRVWVNAC